MKTEQLIGLLAQDDRRLPRIGLRLFPAVLAGVALAGAVGLSLLGVRPDLARTLQVPATAMKLLLPLAAGGVGLLGALHLARPDRHGRDALAGALAVMAVAMLWLVLSLLSTPAGQVAAAVMGQTALACLIIVPAMGLPALAAALYVLRDGASVAPARSGALAGLAAGGLAAATYALHCDEDAPQFFLTWYSLGIAVLVLLGATVGARILRW
ncbi:MAG: DUF1109 domain-containing protein [Mangrovicoccus sp.]|nr:DUF1109 domain-containing protein [Mangrovicoccus sp.]